ncbi:putative transcriptional regulator [Lachnospiraceae bacterium PM6-15]|uniref:helix-turn-helix domain-containing protein n=1 Tax=Ohessyouella blattaphilus TaxID=2949333 RepID=UPI003E2C8703
MKVDDIIQPLDIDILKTNIKRLMKEKDISRKDIQDLLGLSQPRVSQKLNITQKDCFNLDEVYKIATKYHVSIDSLVGLKVSEKNDDTSLGDVVSLLAQLEKIEPFKFGKVTYKEDIFSQGFTDNGGILEREAVSIHYDLSTEGSKAIDTVLTEWKEVNELCEKSPIGERMKKMWIEGQVEEGRERLRKWGYRTKEEESKRLFEQLRQEYKAWERQQGGNHAPCELSGLWFNSDIKLLKEYALEHPYVYTNFDFDNALNLAQKSNGFEIPDGIDEELPFN